MQSLLLWWNTSSSKRFLFSVTCIWFCSWPPTHGEQRKGMTIVGIFIWMQWLDVGVKMHRGGGGGGGRGAVLTLPPLLISLLCGQHCPLVNMLWLSKACFQTVWDCFCLLCPTALPHPTLLHSNHHKLYVEREINIILCLIVCLIVVFIAFF